MSFNYLVHWLFYFRLESTTSEVYKLRKVDGEKQKRINSFKIKLEGSAQGVHEIITNKDEKIKSLEEKYVAFELNFLTRFLYSNCSSRILPTTQLKPSLCFNPVT